MTGLGVTTVSKALKDAPDIGQATKARVRLIADQIGYRPNRAGLRLRTGKTLVISLILNTEEEIMGMSSDLIHGISTVLAGTSYHLVVTPYTKGADPMTPVRYVVESGSADGIILSRTEPNDARVRYLLDTAMPFATHGRTDMGAAHAFHDFDNESFARHAVDTLAGLGRTRLALLGAPAGLTYARHLNSGFLVGIADHGLRAAALTPLSTDDSIQTIAASVRRLFGSPSAPDGIVCASAGAGIGVAYGAEQAGLTLGREFDIVAKQTALDLLRWVRPGFHVVNEDFKAAGSDLARQVLAQIDGAPAAGLQTIAAPGKEQT